MRTTAIIWYTSRMFRQFYFSNLIPSRQRFWLALMLGFGLGPIACGLASPANLLVEAGFITPTPTPDPFSHYRALLQPAAKGDIEAVGPLPQYHITAKLNPNLDQLTGLAQVYIPNPEQEIVFRLYPNLNNYEGEIVVSRAFLNKQPIVPELIADDTALRLTLPAPAAPAPLAAVTIDLEFEVFFKQKPFQDQTDYTLFGWDGSTLSLAGFYPTLAVKQDETWVLDQPPRHADVLFNEVALYQLDLTLPKDLVVVASGVTLNLIDNPDSSRTWQISGGPLRDMTVIAGPFEAISEPAAGAVVTAYYLPGHKTSGQIALAHAAASLRLYSELYGAYPYTELDVVEAPLNVRGMEYSGLILIGEELYRGQREHLTFLVAHEVGHQWWYSLVGNNPYQHPWLDEGLTEYGAFDYYRGVFGRPDAEQLLTGRWQIPFESAASNLNGAIDRPAHSFDPTSYELLVYAKSALFFNALRETLGDELYFQVLQTYLAENRYRIATPNTFLATAERVSGQDLAPVVEQWLR